jgi:hypothetical protein
MPGSSIDSRTLPTTSEKRKIPWRKNRVALVVLRAKGYADQAYVIAEKLRLVDAAGRTIGYSPFEALRIESCCRRCPQGAEAELAR